ncbi:MAG: hypothetical protein DI536_24945 [Archangium gephyra]|uniref:DUF1552 domain-containing protein n=1 Tax=Archangium gephyra TaxID=48 RepID=A0A2W5SY95_9BACT|nr:MAG: hypothetical protein DI536_24945 [Archangium gephyra]
MVVEPPPPTKCEPAKQEVTKLLRLSNHEYRAMVSDVLGVPVDPALFAQWTPVAEVYRFDTMSETRIDGQALQVQLATAEKLAQLVMSTPALTQHCPAVGSTETPVCNLKPAYTAIDDFADTQGRATHFSPSSGDPGVARCGKTLDQYIADVHPSSLRSLEIGGIYYHVHPLNDHPGYSNDYLNRISWQAADKFRSPIPNPAQLFEKLFGGQEGSAAQVDYLIKRKKSVLDTLHKDATRSSNRLSSTYRPVLQSYMETVREVEMGLSTGGFTCTPNLAKPTQDFSNPNANYVLRFQLMHQLLVLAMQCGLTNVATLMYGPGVSEYLSFNEALGGGSGHHAVAHHGGTQSSIDRLKQMNRVQTGLLADLLTKLKAANLLNETLVLYGSDMSDGNVHLTENLPMLLCGAGGDLRFGQEIVPSSRRPVADLHIEIAKSLGINWTSFGSSDAASSGQTLGVRT